MPRHKRVPGSIDRRGDSYRVRLCVDGERYVFTVATTDRRVAQAFAIKREQELKGQAARRLAGLVTGRRVSELFSKFETEVMPTKAQGTQEAYADSLKPIRRYFVDEIGDPTVESVRAGQVAGFLTWRRVNRLKGTKPLSNRTLQKDRTVLHGLFAYADQLEWRDGPPSRARLCQRRTSEIR